MEWKCLEFLGYDNYFINNNGEIKYISKNKEKDKKYIIDKDGYFRVKINKNNKTKYYYVHRLVAIAFIPNPNNLPCVNHKDENKSNNNVDNLEWCTIAYNNNYGNRNKKASETMRKKYKNGNCYMTGKHHSDKTKMKIKEANSGDKNYASIKVFCEGKIFGTILECANYYNVKYSTMKYWLSIKMNDEFNKKGLKIISNEEYFALKELDKQK